MNKILKSKVLGLAVILFMVIIGSSTNAIATSKVLDIDFENTCGSSLLDGSGLNNNGNMHSGHLLTGVRGKGILMDGIDDYISIPDSPSLDVTTGLTLQGWIWLDPNALGSGTLFYKYKFVPNWPLYNDGRGYVITVDGQYLTVDLYGGYGTRVLMSHGPLDVEKWVHVTITYDGSFARIYLNGVEVANSPYSDGIAVNDEELKIGQLSSGFFFRGMLDEIKVYDYALSAGDVL